MLVFIAQNLAPIMFVSLFVFLLLGYPVAFSLAAVGLAYFAIGVQLAPYAPDTINLDWALIGVMPDRIYGIMNNETLLAVPFFTLMGLILERSGMAEDLLDTIGQLFGSVKGGLAFAVIFVGALLAATTGVVAASVISMGLISLPIMLRYGYDRRMAAGVIAASGTLAQIIPPSLVLIVMADQLGRSVGDMYKGAFIPGFILTFLYAGYVVLVSLLKPEAAPALPPEARIIKEDPTKATRQALLTVIGLLAFGVVFYYFLIYAASALAGAAGYSLADQPVERKWALAVILSIASFGWRLVGDAFRRTGAAPRLNTTATFGAMVALSYLMFLWFARVFPATPGENLAVWAGFAGIAILYMVALADQAIGTNVMGDLTQRVVIALVPPLALVFLVLGTIFVGIATPTEGGAMGATGALVLALARRRLSFDLLRQAVDTTAKLSCFVVFILIGARVFSLTFYGVNGHLWVEHLLTSLPGGQVGFLAVVNLIVFVLAFFLDFFELAFIIIPLLAPVADKLGIDLIWFGVMLGVNLQTSFMHPPFGFALFYLRSVAPTKPYQDRISGKTIAPVTTGQIYLGAIPFVIIQVIMVALVIAFPAMVLVYKAGEVKLDKQQYEQELKNLAPPPSSNDEPPPLKF